MSAGAQRAVKELHGKNLLERRANVQLAIKPVPAAAAAQTIAANALIPAIGKRTRDDEHEGGEIDDACAAWIMKVDPGFDAALQYIAMQRKQVMMT